MQTYPVACLRVCNMGCNTERAFVAGHGEEGQLQRVLAAFQSRIPAGMEQAGLFLEELTRIASLWDEQWLHTLQEVQVACLTHQLPFSTPHHPPYFGKLTNTFVFSCVGCHVFQAGRRW
jgi:hypothetical protein